MKITIIGPSYPLRGGIAHHVFWLKKELTGRGHTVQIISFRKLYPELIFPGTTQTDVSNLKLDAGGLPLLTPLNPAGWIRAASEVKAFGPDVILIQWWQPFFAPVVGTLARIFRRAGKRIVIECHNVLPHEGTPADRLLVKFAFSPVDYFIVHSQSDRRELESIAAGKRVSLSALPSLEEFSKESVPTRQGRTALFFGIVRKYKGLDVLLRAMPKVLSELECRLIIAGEFYDPVASYRRLIGDLGISERVELQDRYVPNEDVPALFEKADVLVLPYLSATQSGVARIALSNSLPMIAARTGGLSEIVSDGVNGLLFPPGDSEALAASLVDYFKNKLGPVFAVNMRRSNAASSDCALVEIIETIGIGSREKRVADKVTRSF